MKTKALYRKMFLAGFVAILLFYGFMTMAGYGDSGDFGIIDRVLADAVNAPASVTLNVTNLLGDWINIDPNTRGITRIVITSNSGVLNVHVYGSCVPTDCDWGTTTGTPYAKSVDAMRAKAFTANYDAGFAKTILTGQRKGSYLRLSDFTHFTDNSDRSDYFSAGIFQRQP